MPLATELRPDPLGELTTLAPVDLLAGFKVRRRVREGREGEERKGKGVNGEKGRGRDGKIRGRGRW